MRLDDFRIGDTFALSGGLWRCTDIGSRVVVAIRIDQVDVESVSIEHGAVSPASSRRLDRAEAEAEGWFKGPPFAVAEMVFDEYDQQACERSPAKG